MSNLYADQAAPVSVLALQQGTHQYVVAGGAADAYSATPTPPVVQYVEGVTLLVKIPVDSTGACTLSLSGLTPKAIKTPAGADPDAGALQAGGVYLFAYDGTAFQVLNPTPAATP